MMWGWVLAQRPWSLWSEMRHVNVMDDHLTIGCVIYHDPWSYRLTSARKQQERLSSSSAGLWDCDVTWASHHQELLPHPLLQVPAGWVGQFWRIPHCQHSYLCFILGNEGRQLVYLPNEEMTCWYHRDLCVPFRCNHEHQRKGFETALWVFHTQFHVYSEIKE